MSTFKNLTKADLWLGSPDGERLKVAAGATFTGSNYYQRWCYPQVTADQIILQCLADDGIPYSPAHVPNLLRSWEFTVEPGEDWADHTFDFLSADIFRAPAQFVQIMVDDSSLLVRVNKEDNSTFRMDADSTQVFNRGELLVSGLEFKNPSTTGGIAATVRLLAATIAAS